MEAHGLSAQASILPGGLEQEHGARAAAELLEGSGHELPTAITAFNDRVAFGLLQGLLMAGADVPGRVSVIGFDNARRSDAALVPLTTINQNPSLRARRFAMDSNSPASETACASAPAFIPALSRTWPAAVVGRGPLFRLPRPRAGGLPAIGPAKYIQKKTGWINLF